MARFLDLACLTYRDDGPERWRAAEELLAEHPELPRSVKVPLYPVIPILAILGSLWIISSLRLITIYAFVVWVALAFVWSLVYARKHSHLGRQEHVGLAAQEDQP